MLGLYWDWTAEEDDLQFIPVMHFQRRPRSKRMCFQNLGAFLYFEFRLSCSLEELDEARLIQ
jgi:hypothetical protein